MIQALVGQFFLNSDLNKTYRLVHLMKWYYSPVNTQLFPEVAYERPKNTSFRWKFHQNL